MTTKIFRLSPILLLGLVAVVPPATAEELDGKTLFVETHKCSMCHTVPAAEIEATTKSDKMKGPELGGTIDVDFAEIASFVRREADLDGKKHTKPFKGTDEELQAIVDWLGTLEAPTQESG